MLARRDCAHHIKGHFVRIARGEFRLSRHSRDARRAGPRPSETREVTQQHAQQVRGNNSLTMHALGSPFLLRLARTQSQTEHTTSRTVREMR